MSVPMRGSRARAAWWRRLGIAGFAFFLVKGLFWLVAPALVYLLGW